MKKNPAFIIALLCLCGLVRATALSDLAGQMKPGEWRQLTTLNADPVIGHTAGGATGNIFPYADGIVWDPGSHRLYFVGSDHQHATGYGRFVTYSETTNTWTELPRPIWFPALTEEAMHGYDQNAINTKTGEFYHKPLTARRSINRFSIPLNSWRSGFSIPTSIVATDAQMACCAALSYFPEYNGLVVVDGGNGSGGMIYALNLTTYRWVMLKSGLSMGDIHNMAEYNPVHKVLIGGGGNGSGNFYKMDSAGNITAIRNAPGEVRINQEVLTVDPAGGDYLLFTHSRQFYTYNVKTDAWTEKSGGSSAPIYTTNGDGPMAGVVATPVSNYGVVLFVSCNGSGPCWVSVYKHAEPASVEKGPAIRTSGLSAFPNPFTGSTLLHFQARSAHAPQLRIYDVHGKLICDLAGQARNGSATFRAADLPGGLYICELRSESVNERQKLFVMK